MDSDRDSPVIDPRRIRIGGGFAPRDPACNQQHGSGVEKIVRRGTFRRRLIKKGALIAVTGEQSPPLFHAGWIDRAFDLLGQGHRTAVIEPPECHLGMRLENARS